MVVGFLREQVVNHAHGHSRESLIGQAKLRAAEHKGRAGGLSGRRSYFFFGVDVVC